MDTCQKKRSAYFTPLELEILTESYSAFEDIFQRKSNSVSAVKEREAAWRTIADRVNACNLSSEKRTWSQLKMKYKNIIQTANRKKAEVRRASGEPAPSLSPARPPKEEEEEMAVSQDTGTIEGIKERCRPVLDGLRGGISSQPLAPQDTSAFVKYCDGVICLVEPNTLTPLIVAAHYGSTKSEWYNKDDVVKTLSMWRIINKGAHILKRWSEVSLMVCKTSSMQHFDQRTTITCYVDHKEVFSM
ncbi:uncharacterized protein [Nerophis lumbriciformis]|uniref:uncharacterized protein isoform X2 n=1 Tax=Nerophis lumbriciformis TaxID=546530 RepID=UPI002AE04F4B|nr:uncharacterized protein LOC133578416 isoform X2 [Nerophis lumbriciformis]